MGNCQSDAQGSNPPRTVDASSRKSRASSRPEQPSQNAAPSQRRKNKTTTDDTSSKTTKDAKEKKSLRGRSDKEPEVEDQYKKVDASRWKCNEFRFNGAASYQTMGKKETIKGKDIAKGVKKFKASPEKYVAMTYQTNMVTDDWPTESCIYAFIHRKGTVAYKPSGLSNKGFQTVLLHEYERLPKLDGDILPKQYRDNYTDNMVHHGRRLHSARNQPLMPGRGMGCCDEPNLKIIGDVDPSDIHQGTVGNCWMLSGISALAEFDGAIKHLFRKTKNLNKRPFDKPNKYTVTLWDLSTWKEVDIVIDERLAVDLNGHLLASKPSEDGELWVCYLEKALAIHCGGWDKITGGQCTHAWALMTGCRDQYFIRQNPKTGMFACFAKYDPNTHRWANHNNAPHDGDQRVWQVSWPSIGGGGDGEITMEELFQKMCAWDKQNFIVGAGTSGKSDKNRTDGMVDNHAYSVIDCFDKVAGTKFGMMKVRNPWGKGEIEDGMFDDDGPGWDKYPQVKKALKPVVADDGIFWVTKEEFFKYFQTIYLSASDMTAFLED